jgi:hypothetical protein
MPGIVDIHNIMTIAADSYVRRCGKAIAASQMDIVRPNLDIGRHFTRQRITILAGSIHA